MKIRKKDFILSDKIENTNSDDFCVKCLEVVEDKKPCKKCGYNVVVNKEVAIYRARIKDVKDYLIRENYKIISVKEEEDYNLLCERENGSRFNLWIDKPQYETLEELIIHINTSIRGDW